MNNHMKYGEYIKCGDILIPPSLNNMDQYILRCGDCDEYYSSFGEFLNHHFSYHHIVVKDEDDISEHNHHLQIKSEHDSAAQEEMNDEDSCFTSINPNLVLINETQSSHVKEDVVERYKEEELIDYPETDDECKDSEDNKSSIFVSNFMKSEEKLKLFIAAYKNQPYLWNFNLPKRSRTKERPKDLEIIAARLKEQIDQDFTPTQVASVIRRIRLKYKEQLKYSESNGEYVETVKDKKQSPIWFMDHLHFLKPFMENTSIVNLDSLQPEISAEQIIQILGIYERLPNLWNTNLIENCCTNKRLEALGQMEIIVETEMGLKISQTTLKRYIRCIHYHFTREKRLDIDNVDSIDGKSEFYKHMTFLSEHVGPFKCNDCKREFKSPLALKVHKSQHDGLVPLKCSMCNKDYRTTEAYMSHARRHMNDLKQQCNQCGKKFLKYTELEIHMRSHTGAKPYFCELCGASFRHNHAFATHKRRHEKKYLHNCPICSKGFYKKDHMDNHLRTHGIMQDFACEICGKGYKSKKTLQQHGLTHNVKASLKTND